jgi:hypothetical protein
VLRTRETERATRYAIAQTGWVLYEYVANSTNRPTMTQIAGCPAAARVQLCRFRRQVQVIGTRSQILWHAWSTQFFEVNHNRFPNPTPIRPDQFPQTVELTTITALREARAQTSGSFTSVVHWNSFSNATFNLTEPNRFYAFDTFAGNSNTQFNRSVLAIVTTNPGQIVRLLVIGSHDSPGTDFSSGW